MKKTTSIDFSEDRLLAIASNYIDDHNLIGALKMLNKNAIINGNGEQSYMYYAEIYDDMGLYERCINGWFKYIDYVGEEADLSEAYEGLAVSFLNLGHENYAAYYYNKLLMETDETLTDEDREDIINTFLSTDENHLKIAYPPRLADYSEEFKNGINFMRENDFERAINEFSKVHEQSDKHLTARNYIAMCNIICDKCDEAEQECNAILQKDSQNIQALTTLAAVKRQQNKSEESIALAQRLLSLEPSESEDIYKIATVCCENGLHEEAYKLFCKLEGMDLTYDLNLQFFKAIAAYNCGYTEKSLECLDKILTINPSAVTAEYYLSYIKSHRKSKTYYIKHPLSYFYRLPQKERELNLKFLSAFVEFNKSLSDYILDMVDISNAVKWCFDEAESKNSFELQLLGATCAVQAGLDDLLKDILLDASVSDGVKVEILSLLTERNEGRTLGVVICNLYRKLYIPKINLGKSKHKCFLQAYAKLISRFAMLNTDYVYLINAATTKYYSLLEEEGRLSACKHSPAVAAAIYSYSGIEELGDKDEDICAFFGASINEYRGLIGK
jgi:tetratricopeptide (TPR) repeat protein